ncbi:GDP-fucose protein O-fucosyltransferase-domain-containing protein [Gamsiella multidivaricata]|uniref:GDP-fucose protein O-fucosyltransferase-domain-containing protein n=1 Tax=Gamsiella multidivaricata TaxID=101098 RepID=UPI0022201702|nr:GDP-fucose protein O-fucosyltransferase-domain-containing protein [Gamsiella multidivaricata]KAG0362904.1 hypothetical protein BGZ54_008438 [Gamsiella multidivaricata]KAI7817813.1 GDP-fucose protein O-fucosyltransferase-domain-containing protein [Gamsiella multidivaricata]
MPSSPKALNRILALPAKYPFGRRCHSHQRILFLFALILLVSSGSMLILHTTSSSFTRFDSLDSLSCQTSASYSSSSDCQTPDYKGTYQNGRPRTALPRPAENLGIDRPEQDSKAAADSSEDTTQSPPLNSGSNNSDNEQEIEEETVVARPFEDTLDKHDTKYLTYLPYAGITNQFYGMLRGMEVAKALGRTLIIPPITASSHDKSKQNQPWSKFLDLARFTELTGIKIVEFHQLRDAEQAELSELKCGITCGFGSKRTIDFTAKSFLKQWKFNVTLEPLAADVTKLEMITSMLAPRKDEKYLCISNTYKIMVKDKSEWERFGQHLHFTEELESFVEDFMEENLVKPEPKVDPKTKQEIEPEYEYLAIHVRRGDFAAYCEGNFQGPKMVHCLPSTEQIAERIDVVQSKLNLSMDFSKMLPVFVATNERRPEELKKFADLGWRYLDHEQMGTAERLGVFGPMMVDQVFMAHAQGFVGIQMSTFSRVGVLRQLDWHGRQAEYM